MENRFDNLELSESGVIYKSNFEQVIELYNDDKELAGELAISILELALAGETKTDNKLIKLLLKNFEVSAAKNRERYLNTKESKEDEYKKKYNLYEIAYMLNHGSKQAEIAQKLHTTQQTISNRIKTIREKYPELLNTSDTSNFTRNTSDTSNTSGYKCNLNYNYNLNDNLNVPAKKEKEKTNSKWSLEEIEKQCNAEDMARELGL